MLLPVPESEYPWVMMSLMALLKSLSSSYSHARTAEDNTQSRSGPAMMPQVRGMVLARMWRAPSASIGCSIRVYAFHTPKEERMFTRTKMGPVPEVGAEAPEFNLPSAQGGQLRLSMRTVRGPVVVAFYRPGDEEDVEYFKALAAKEEEINMAAGSVVAIGVAEPTEARNFARASALKSYVLYDYARVTSRQWGLLEKDKKRGDHSRPAVFIVGPDHKVANAWVGKRPGPDEILAKISEISGLPKSPEEPKDTEKEVPEGGERPKKMSAEEREKIKAQRRAAREAG